MRSTCKKKTLKPLCPAHKMKTGLFYGPKPRAHRNIQNHRTGAWPRFQGSWAGVSPRKPGQAATSAVQWGQASRPAVSCISHPFQEGLRLLKVGEEGFWEPSRPSMCCYCFKGWGINSTYLFKACQLTA